jgi:hypothetical protein
MRVEREGSMRNGVSEGQRERSTEFMVLILTLKTNNV